VGIHPRLTTRARGLTPHELSLSDVIVSPELPRFSVARELMTSVHDEGDGV
jgi:hypothetical protein